jgi:LPXTG-motif cell wall-anchored protein
MKALRLFAVVIVAGACAGFALAQNAKVVGAGPTANDYRIRLVQPLEGARIVGTSFQVIVNTEIVGQEDTRIDVDSIPRPGVIVFVDDQRRGTMKDDNNVVAVDNVAPGPHKIVIEAVNLANEVIDRKVVNVLVVPEPKTAPVVQRHVPPPAPAPALAPPPAAAPPAPPAPVAQALPKTGTSDPLLAVAGLGLLLGGLALRRLV